MSDPKTKVRLGLGLFKFCSTCGKINQFIRDEVGHTVCANCKKA